MYNNHLLPFLMDEILRSEQHYLIKDQTFLSKYIQCYSKVK
jgi:hypothetical protein